MFIIFMLGLCVGKYTTVKVQNVYNIKMLKLQNIYLPSTLFMTL